MWKFIANMFSEKSITHRLYVLPLLIILMGLGLGINAELEQRAEDKLNVGLALKNGLGDFRSQIIERLTFYSYGVKSLDSLITAVGKDNFNDEAVRSFERSRNFQTEFPGVRGFGFIKYVAAGDLDSFIARQQSIRSDGQFQVKHLSEDLEYLFIIRDILPESANASAIGLNIGSEASRRTAAINSVARNDITITAPITLVQADKSIKQGFLILQPFFDANKGDALSLDNTWGWTYAPIVIDEVVESIGRIDDTIVFSITHEDSENSQLFYNSAPKGAQKTFQSQSELVSVFGSNWRFEAKASEAFVNGISKQAPYKVLIEFSIFSLLVAIIIFCLHLIVLKRFESKEYAVALAKAKETSLKEANRKLEYLVESRTQEIKKSASFKKAVLESSAYPIVATDENGIITVFNPAAETLLGYRADELINQETPAIFHLESEIIARAKTLFEEFACAVAPGFEVFIYKPKLYGKEETQWTYVDREGSHIKVKLSVTPLLDDNNRLFGFLGIAYDLTEQSAYEQIIKTEKERAEQATVAKSQFLANMSHEIRTPLHGVKGALQIIEGKPLTTELATLVKIALRSIKTMSLLVDDILDFSKVEAGKIQITPRTFSMDVLLDSLYQEFKNIAYDKHLEFEFKKHLNSDIWIGDDLRIKQIFANLISNAIKFTRVGCVTLEIKGADDGIVFTVTDSGIGMTESGLSVLFNRFEQADTSITRSFGGSGLGMSITKSLIELMGGSIHTESEINKGSCFTVSLPLVPVDQELAVNKQASDTHVDLSDYSILVAEDNEINQIIIETMLSDAGANVVITKNGQHAVDEASRSDFDLIVLDIQMPVLDGMQACSQIKAKQANVPIIALTANVFPEDIAKYERVGFSACMGKPFEKSELLALVYASLDSNRPERAKKRQKGQGS